MFAQYRLIFIFLLMCFFSAASAQQMSMADAPTSGHWMTGEEILAEYTDSTQEGMYSWLQDGVPVGFSESHDANAQTRYQEFGSEDFTIRGVWIVKNDVICYYYSDWRMSPENCFYVLKSGNCYYHYDTERERNFEGLESWNSVSYDKGTQPSCVPNIS